jgi:hypothetical protein
VGFSVHADFSQVAKSCGESVHSEQNNNVSQPSGTFSSHYYSESEAYTRYPNLGKGLRLVKKSAAKGNTNDFISQSQSQQGRVQGRSYLSNAAKGTNPSAKGMDVTNKPGTSMESAFGAALHNIPPPKRISKRKRDPSSSSEEHYDSDQSSSPDQFSERESQSGSDDDYAMFAPECENNAKHRKLSKSQNKFVDKYFTSYVKDDIVREHIMKEAPIPSNPTLVVPEMDSDWMALVPFKSETITAEDGALSRIQTKVVRTMGPLGLLWQQLDSFRKEGRGTCDLSEVLPLIEKSVLLTGQAFRHTSGA